MNLVLEVKVVGESENRLARWLAYEGAMNRTRIVLYMRLSGRLKEIWMLDMGLGPIHGNYQVLAKDEYEMIEMEAEEVQLHGTQVVEISDEESDGEEAMDNEEDAQMAVFGAGLQGMGQHG